jgi:hypothetical protein
MAMIFSLFNVFLFGLVASHSWVEQLVVIRNGLFTGDNGYPRGYVPRDGPTFRDDMMTYRLPPSASKRDTVNASDLICPHAQRTYNQTLSFGRLQASPGDYIAMKYQENGHVTSDITPPGKPLRGGTVLVYGTSLPNAQDKLLDVLAWTRSGEKTQRGVLLTLEAFDDGRCYEIGTNSSLAIDRQRRFPNPYPASKNTLSPQWCETDVQLPAAVQNSTYTLYWVWFYSAFDGDKRVDEIYTSCSDVDIVSAPVGGTPRNPLPQQDPQIKAVVNYRERAASPASKYTAGTSDASKVTSSLPQYTQSLQNTQSWRNTTRPCA